MTGDRSEFWSLRAETRLDLPFPYAGENYASLTVRKRGAKGRPEVMFLVDKGQILCHPGDCQVRVRFDDKPVSTFSADRAASGRSDVIFIENVTRFLQGATTAKQIRIEASFYNVGKVVSVFEPDAPLRLQR